MNPGFLFPFLHRQSHLQFLDQPIWASQPDWMSGWIFSAIPRTSSLYSTSSFWTTVVRIIQLSAVLTGTSLFAPAAFFPGCGHENLHFPIWILCLARIIHEPQWIHEQSALRASTPTIWGLRSGLTLSQVWSTESKPAWKRTAFLQVLIYESLGFVNHAG